MIQLPLSNDPASRVTVDTGSGVFIFATYWMPTAKLWLMDIMDSSGNALLTGISLVPGIDNLLKGHGELFKGVSMIVVCEAGTYNNTPDSLGKTAQVKILTATDINPITYTDPLL